MLGPLPHAHQPYSLACRSLLSGPDFKAFTIIADFQVQTVLLFFHRHPRFPGAGVARHVAQRFLHDSIDVNGRLGRKQAVGELALVMHLDTRLARELVREPPQGLFQAEIIQNGGTKNLRLVANASAGYLPRSS